MAEFFRRKSRSSFEFVLPNVEDNYVVNESSFYQKLPTPDGSSSIA
jgi:hypothetical protein